MPVQKSCGHNGCDCGGGGGCKGKYAWKADLAELYASEPWCGNSSCKLPIGANDDCRRAIAGLVQQGVLQYEVGQGEAAVRFPNGFCIAVAALCCGSRHFGPHFNDERRVSDFSPRDIESVASSYHFTHEVLPANSSILGESYALVPNSGTWRVGWLAPLGISHEFCLEEISIVTDYTYTFVDADPQTITTPGTITAVAIGGIIISCGDGAAGADEGSYVRTLASPTQADPDAIDVTPERCACEELCDWTPARGAELFYFKYTPSAAPATPPGGTLISISQRASVKVRRCGWLSGNALSACVNAKGNLINADNGITTAVNGVPLTVRAVGGNVPFLGS